MLFNFLKREIFIKKEKQTSTKHRSHYVGYIEEKKRKKKILFEPKDTSVCFFFLIFFFQYFFKIFEREKKKKKYTLRDCGVPDRS